MSGQGYVSSALARYLIEYFIDTFLVDPRQTLVQALINLEEESLRTPVAAVVEDQLIPVQARQTQKGKPQKPHWTGNGGQTNTIAGATKRGGRVA